MGGEVVRVFGEEIVCANIVFADGLTHVVAAFSPPISVSKQGLMGDFKWCSWFCFQFEFRREVSLFGWLQSLCSMFKMRPDFL